MLPLFAPEIGPLPPSLRSLRETIEHTFAGLKSDSAQESLFQQNAERKQRNEIIGTDADVSMAVQRLGTGKSTLID
ncbi:hypothetical protein [Polystyrenella longa]|uniref:hypothetical protein n=1 Tax=Polystyrenella longa TaxID=2528007 RepID=UPI00119ED553|nr:hypothetical protein [Polystyrenella longa]